jgi:hypothetical protein
MVCLAGPPHAATEPSTNAAALYRQAAEQIRSESPAESVLVFNDYPPFPESWKSIETRAFERNQKVFELTHQARSLKKASWPEGKDLSYIHPIRRVANQLADAALFEHLHNHHAAAIELVRDGLHLAELLRERPGTSLERSLTAVGIQAVALNRLLVISSGINLSDDENGTDDLNVRVARELIAELLDQGEPKAQAIELFGPEGSPAWNDPSAPSDRVIETLNRANAERTYAAMSLSCHLFHHDRGHWPAALEELVPSYLPRVPVDPWGDGRQTFGYVLIKNGLPDGSHRPVVYSRCFSSGEMFYRLDGPQYGLYTGFTTDPKTGARQRGGQFRDVARWVPVARPAGSPDAARLP